MLICDLHCDLPDKVSDGKTISNNGCHWNEAKLKKAHTYVQTFAHFVDAGKHPNAFLRVDTMLKNFKERLRTTSLGLVLSPADLEENIRTGRPSAILSIEGGEALDGKPENIQYFYDLGVRFLTLTWNLKNDICESCVSGDAPLTDFGKAVVREMNRLHMTPDVSHMCEKGFWSTLETSVRPIVATHSNAKKLCSHARNLTDEQFVAIKNCGGLVGINFYAPFLENDTGKASLTSIIKHIEHFLALGGEDTLCLGGDLDGMLTPAKGISGIGDVDKIANAMAKLNYSDDLIAKIMGENVRRFVGMWF